MNIKIFHGYQPTIDYNFIGYKHYNNPAKIKATVALEYIQKGM